jgi:hypothetical protein
VLVGLRQEQDSQGSLLRFRREAVRRRKMLCPKERREGRFRLLGSNFERRIARHNFSVVGK